MRILARVAPPVKSPQKASQFKSCGRVTIDFGNAQDGAFKLDFGTV
jgi:hypothetical protein